MLIDQQTFDPNYNSSLDPTIEQKQILKDYNNINKNSFLNQLLFQNDQQQSQDNINLEDFNSHISSSQINEDEVNNSSMFEAYNENNENQNKSQIENKSQTSSQARRANQIQIDVNQIKIPQIKTNDNINNIKNNNNNNINQIQQNQDKRPEQFNDFFNNSIDNLNKSKSSPDKDNISLGDFGSVKDGDVSAGEDSQIEMQKYGFSIPQNLNLNVGLGLANINNPNLIGKKMVFNDNSSRKSDVFDDLMSKHSSQFAEQDKTDQKNTNTADLIESLTIKDIEFIPDFNKLSQQQNFSKQNPQSIFQSIDEFSLAKSKINNQDQEKTQLQQEKQQQQQSNIQQPNIFFDTQPKYLQNSAPQEVQQLQQLHQIQDNQLKNSTSSFGRPQKNINFSDFESLQNSALPQQKQIHFDDLLSMQNSSAVNIEKTQGQLNFSYLGSVHNSALNNNNNNNNLNSNINNNIKNFDDFDNFNKSMPITNSQIIQDNQLHIQKKVSRQNTEQSPTKKSSSNEKDINFSDFGSVVVSDNQGKQSSNRNKSQDLFEEQNKNSDIFNNEQQILKFPKDLNSNFNFEDIFILNDQEKQKKSIELHNPVQNIQQQNQKPPLNSERNQIKQQTNQMEIQKPPESRDDRKKFPKSEEQNELNSYDDNIFLSFDKEEQKDDGMNIDFNFEVQNFHDYLNNPQQNTNIPQQQNNNPLQSSNNMSDNNNRNIDGKADQIYKFFDQVQQGNQKNQQPDFSQPNQQQNEHIQNTNDIKDFDQIKENDYVNQLLNKSNQNNLKMFDQVSEKINNNNENQQLAPLVVQQQEQKQENISQKQSQKDYLQKEQNLGSLTSNSNLDNKMKAQNSNNNSQTSQIVDQDLNNLNKSLEQNSQVLEQQINTNDNFSNINQTIKNNEQTAKQKDENQNNVFNPKTFTMMDNMIDEFGNQYIDTQNKPQIMNNNQQEVIKQNLEQNKKQNEKELLFDKNEPALTLNEMAKNYDFLKQVSQPSSTQSKLFKFLENQDLSDIQQKASIPSSTTSQFQDKKHLHFSGTTDKEQEEQNLNKNVQSNIQDPSQQQQEQEQNLQIFDKQQKLDNNNQNSNQQNNDKQQSNKFIGDDQVQENYYYNNFTNQNNDNNTLQKTKIKLPSQDANNQQYQLYTHQDQSRSFDATPMSQNPFSDLVDKSKSGDQDRIDDINDNINDQNKINKGDTNQDLFNVQKEKKRHSSYEFMKIQSTYIQKKVPAQNDQKQNDNNKDYVQQKQISSQVVLESNENSKIIDSQDVKAVIQSIVQVQSQNQTPQAEGNLKKNIFSKNNNIEKNPFESDYQENSQQNSNIISNSDLNNIEQSSIKQIFSQINTPNNKQQQQEQQQQSKKTGFIPTKNIEKNPFQSDSQEVSQNNSNFMNASDVQNAEKNIKQILSQNSTPVQKNFPQKSNFFSKNIEKNPFFSSDSQLSEKQIEGEDNENKQNKNSSLQNKHNQNILNDQDKQSIQYSIKSVTGNNDNSKNNFQNESQLKQQQDETIGTNIQQIKNNQNQQTKQLEEENENQKSNRHSNSKRKSIDKNPFSDQGTSNEEQKSMEKSQKHVSEQNLNYENQKKQQEQNQFGSLEQIESVEQSNKDFNFMNDGSLKYEQGQDISPINQSEKDFGKKSGQLNKIFQKNQQILNKYNQQPEKNQLEDQIPQIIEIKDQSFEESPFKDISDIQQTPKDDNNLFQNNLFNQIQNQQVADINMKSEDILIDVNNTIKVEDFSSLYNQNYLNQEQYNDQKQEDQYQKESEYYNKNENHHQEPIFPLIDLEQQINNPQQQIEQGHQETNTKNLFQHFLQTYLNQGQFNDQKQDDQYQQESQHDNNNKYYNQEHIFPVQQIENQIDNPQQQIEQGHQETNSKNLFTHFFQQILKQDKELNFGQQQQNQNNQNFLFDNNQQIHDEQQYQLFPQNDFDQNTNKLQVNNLLEQFQQETIQKQQLNNNNNFNKEIEQFTGFPAQHSQTINFNNNFDEHFKEELQQNPFDFNLENETHRNQELKYQETHKNIYIENDNYITDYQQFVFQPLQQFNSNEELDKEYINPSEIQFKQVQEYDIPQNEGLPESQDKEIHEQNNEKESGFSLDDFEDLQQVNNKLRKEKLENKKKPRLEIIHENDEAEESLVQSQYKKKELDKELHEFQNIKKNFEQLQSEKEIMKNNFNQHFQQIQDEMNQLKNQYHKLEENNNQDKLNAQKIASDPQNSKNNEYHKNLKKVEDDLSNTKQEFMQMFNQLMESAKNKNKEVSLKQDSGEILYQQKEEVKQQQQDMLQNMFEETQQQLQDLKNEIIGLKQIGQSSLQGENDLDQQQQNINQKNNNLKEQMSQQQYKQIQGKNQDNNTKEMLENFQKEILQLKNTLQQSDLQSNEYKQVLQQKIEKQDQIEQKIKDIEETVNQKISEKLQNLNQTQIKLEKNIQDLKTEIKLSPQKYYQPVTDNNEEQNLGLSINQLNLLDSGQKNNANQKEKDLLNQDMSPYIKIKQFQNNEPLKQSDYNLDSEQIIPESLLINNQKKQKQNDNAMNQYEEFKPNEFLNTNTSPPNDYFLNQQQQQLINSDGNSLNKNYQNQTPKSVNFSKNQAQKQFEQQSNLRHQPLKNIPKITPQSPFDQEFLDILNDDFPVNNNAINDFRNNPNNKKQKSGNNEDNYSQHANRNPYYLQQEKEHQKLLNNNPHLQQIYQDPYVALKAYEYINNTPNNPFKKKNNKDVDNFSPYKEDVEPQNDYDDRNDIHNQQNLQASKHSNATSRSMLKPENISFSKELNFSINQFHHKYLDKAPNQQNYKQQQQPAEREKENENEQLTDLNKYYEPLIQKKNKDLGKEIQAQGLYFNQNIRPITLRNSVDLKSFKHNCLSNNVILLDSFDFLVTARYQQVQTPNASILGNTESQSLKITIFYQNKMDFEIKNLIIVLQNQKTNEYLNCDPGKINKQIMKPKEKIKQEIYINGFKPLNQLIFSFISFQSPGKRSSIQAQIPLTYNKFVDYSFFNADQFKLEWEQLNKSQKFHTTPSILNSPIISQIQDFKHVFTCIQDLDSEYQQSKQIWKEMAVKFKFLNQQNEFLLKIYHSEEQRVFFEIASSNPQQNSLSQELLGYLYFIFCEQTTN